MSSELRVTTSSPTTRPTIEGLPIERLRTIIQDAHLNFLIGAGTSAPFLAPLGDVEKVLTELKGPGDEIRLARASVQGYFFEKVMVPNLRLLDAASDPDAQSVIKSYGRFVAALNRILLKRRSTLLGKQVNLFTTNVDMATEMALELLEIDTNDGFTGKLRPRLDLGAYNTLRFRQGARFEYRSEIPTVNLFKIHGSAGWRGENDEIHFDHRLELVQEVKSAFESAKTSLLTVTTADDVDTEKLKAAADGRSYDAAAKKFASGYRHLQIVNPEKTKFASTVLNKTYYELIRRFANELEKENAALFVHGFSFRDEHLLDLVLRAAATNPTLQVVVFCYSRKAHAEISVLFPPERVKNGNVLLIQPGVPSEGDTERKLSLDVVVSDLLERVLDEKVPSADHIIELKLGTTAGTSNDA
ncbi:hypothetical protein [Leucobacter sp.]